MCKKYLVFIACCFSVLGLNAQDLDYAKSIVKTLSSEEYDGRGYVNDGVKRAADLILNEFTRNELQSFYNSYLQCFDVDVNTFPNNLFLKVDSFKLKPGVDYIIDPSSPSLKGKFETINLKASEIDNVDKVKKLIKRLKNKVLLIDERGFEPADKEAYNSILKYLKYNGTLKSKATIVVTDKKLTWHLASQQTKRPTFVVNTTQSFDKVETVLINIDAELLNSYMTCNVIGYIPGVVNADSMLVFTAHYDHLGRMGKETYIPGANDNASGVAMLFTLMKHFKENPPNYTIVFIATAAEELGLIGAKSFVENPKFSLKKIKFLINFDLAGTGNEGIKVVNAKQYPEQFERLKSINQKFDYLKAVQSRGEACNSDHCMFYMKGVPCFYIYTLSGISAYHDVYDKYETLPLTKFVDYSKLIINFAESFWENNTP